MELSFSVIYYTNNLISDSILSLCLGKLDEISQETNSELITVSWQSLDREKNIIWPHHILSHENIYRQILKGLEIAQGKVIFLAEHDVLYPLSHFNYTPNDTLAYNRNIYHLTKEGYFLAPTVNFLSTLVAKKLILDRAIRSKIREINRTGTLKWAEPVSNGTFETFSSDDPVLDIRHGSNFTGKRTSETYLETLPYWGDYKQWI